MKQHNQDIFLASLPSNILSKVYRRSKECRDIICWSVCLKQLNKEVNIEPVPVFVMQDATFLAIQQLSYLFSLLLFQLRPVTVLNHPDDALDLLLLEIYAVILQRQQLAQKERFVCGLTIQQVIKGGQVMRHDYVELQHHQNLLLMGPQIVSQDGPAGQHQQIAGQQVSCLINFAAELQADED